MDHYRGNPTKLPYICNCIVCTYRYAHLDPYEPEIHRCIERIRPKTKWVSTSNFGARSMAQSLNLDQHCPCFFGIYLVYIYIYFINIYIYIGIQGSLNYLFGGIKQQHVKIVERSKDISISTWSHTKFGLRYLFKQHNLLMLTGFMSIHHYIRYILRHLS